MAVWVFVAACELSLVVARVQGHVLLIVLASRCRAWALGTQVFSSCGTRDMWDLFQTRDSTRGPCIGRRIPNHRTTSRVPEGQLFVILLKSSSHPKIIL